MSERFNDTVVVAMTFDRHNAKTGDFNQGDADKIVRTAAGIVSTGFDYIVVDGGSHPSTIERLRRLGVTIIPEKKRGIANVIAQSMREGAKTGKKYVIYTEGDKELFPSQLPKVVTKLREGYDFVVPERTHTTMKILSSMRKWEERTISVFQSMVTRNWGDFLYGPRAFRSETIEPLLRKMPTTRLVKVPVMKDGKRTGWDKVLKPAGWEITGFLPAYAALSGLKVGVAPVHAPPMDNEIKEAFKAAFKQRIMAQFIPVMKGIFQASRRAGYSGMGITRIRRSGTLGRTLRMVRKPKAALRWMRLASRRLK